MGLKHYPENANIFFNYRANRQSEAQIDNIRVDILHQSGKAKCLGQTITFEQRETIETKNSIILA